MDNKYQLGKIYTIRNKEDDSKIYIGSTIQPLSRRMATHRGISKIEKFKNMLLYKEVNNDWSSWFIELYENFPCNSKEELCKREGQIIREIGSLNKDIAGRTVEEYKNDNKEKIAEYKLNYNKKYYEQKKEIILEQKKEYNKNNNEKILIKKKQFYDDNKEKILEQDKERRKIKIICEYCNGEVVKKELKRHQKTVKCQKYQT